MSPANADKKSGGRKGGGRQADTDKALKVPPSGGASSQQVEPGDRDDVVSAVAAVRSAASPQGGLRRPVEHDLLLAAIPHPVLVVAEENRIVYGNSAA